MEYGIQMYSIRDIAERSLEEAIKTAAELGFKYIEFAEFFDNTPEQVVSFMEKYGVEVIGSHRDWETLRDDIDGTIAYLKAIGCKRYIIPGAELRRRELLEDFIALINRSMPKIKAAGLELLYHNHAVEFYETDEGYSIHDELLGRTELNFELDTYWAYVAGLDPIKVIDRLGDRVKMIHLKDGMSNGEGRPLGAGTAPVKAVRDYAASIGLDIVVESEDCWPSGREEVSRSMEYLKTIG